MSLTGSYVDESEAETLLDGDLRTNAIAFLALADFTWYLQEASRHIDLLPFRGHKYEYDQALEFPRVIDGVIVGDCDQNAVIPDTVQRACLEEAIAIYAAGSGGIRDLQEQGISQMSIGGKLSYTFVQGACASSAMQSIPAKRYLRRYIGVETR